MATVSSTFAVQRCVKTAHHLRTSNLEGCKSARKRAASKRNLISQLGIDYLSNDRPNSRLNGSFARGSNFVAYRNLKGTCDLWEEVRPWCMRYSEIDLTSILIGVGKHCSDHLIVACEQSRFRSQPWASDWFCPMPSLSDARPGTMNE